MAGGAPTGFWAAVGTDAAAELRDRAAPRNFARGQALMHVGQVPRDVFFLLAGRVKVTATTPAGRTVLLAFRGPGDLIGDLAALDDEPRSATVEALEPVQALAMGRDPFRAFLLERPAATGETYPRRMSQRSRRSPPSAAFASAPQSAIASGN